MNYKVRIQKNKDFQILENNMPIVKGTKFIRSRQR